MNIIDIKTIYNNSVKEIMALLLFEQNLNGIKDLNILRAISTVVPYALDSPSDLEGLFELFYKIVRQNRDLSHPGTYIGPEDINPEDFVEPPITMNSAGIYGQVAFDDNFMYRCIRTGADGLALWVRVALSQDW